jgi:hypothetical protein
MADNYNPLEEEGRAFVSEEDLADSATSIVEEIKNPKVVELPRPRYQALKRSNRTLEADMTVKLDDDVDEFFNSSATVKKSKTEIPKTIKKLKQAGLAISKHPDSALNIPLVPLPYNANDNLHPYHPPDVSPKPDYYTKHLSINQAFTLGEAKKYNIIHLVDQSIQKAIDNVQEVCCRACIRKVSKYGARWILLSVNHNDGSGSVDGPLCGDCWRLWYGPNAIHIGIAKKHLGRLFKLIDYDVESLAQYNIHAEFSKNQLYTCVKCRSCAMGQGDLIWMALAEHEPPTVTGPFCEECSKKL